MATVRDVFDGTAATTDYAYGTGDQISKVTYDSGYESYSYDLFNRLDQWYTYHGTTLLIEKSVKYEEIDEITQSSKPVEWRYDSTGTYDARYYYTYDGNGNIVSETVDGYRTTYVYDSANQLIRENNQRANRTWTWAYDAAGNILTKKEYAYTTGTLGNPLDVVTYTYENSTWGDLLTVYGGVALSYDNIGNLISYGPRSYTWTQGRQLASMSNGTTTWTYAYDAEGMRTSRTNGTTTYTYVYSGSQLSWMTIGDTELQFTYDATGRPLAVVYNGTVYYYALNLQGDVVAILNSSGSAVVYYTYDAWGNPLTTSGSMVNTLGEWNPLRYRGYVYDQDTGLYYLQSRYYNPTWGRFINADALVSTGQGSLANNMFAYCNNNPVGNVDHSGFFGICVLDDPMNVNRSLMTPGMFGGGGGGSVSGVSSSYYARQNVRAYDRYWRNSCYNPNMSWSTGSGNVAGQLQTCANTANAQVSGSGTVAGTYKHSAFAAEVNKLGNSQLRTEVSYLNGQEVAYGTKGSIRFDAMQFNAEGIPIAAWDFKTGAAILTEARITQMLERSGLNIPIHMIK